MGAEYLSQHRVMLGKGDGKWQDVSDGWQDYGGNPDNRFLSYLIKVEDDGAFDSFRIEAKGKDTTHVGVSKLLILAEGADDDLECSSMFDPETSEWLIPGYERYEFSYVSPLSIIMMLVIAAVAVILVLGRLKPFQELKEGDEAVAYALNTDGPYIPVLCKYGGLSDELIPGELATGLFSARKASYILNGKINWTSDY